MKIYKFLSILLFACSSISFIGAENTNLDEQEREIVNSRDVPQADVLKAKKARKQESFLTSKGAKKIKPLNAINITAPLPYPRPYHHVAAVSPYGGTVEMEDGSVWFVASADAHFLSQWYLGDVLTIFPNNHFGRHQYLIFNEHKGIYVRANLKIGPFTRGAFTNRIIFIDHFQGKFQLQDGMVYEISPWDLPLFTNWTWNDAIIIGLNNRQDAFSYPLLFIDVATNTYVAARIL